MDNNNNGTMCPANDLRDELVRENEWECGGEWRVRD
jgi:hypothetical protein